MKVLFWEGIIPDASKIRVYACMSQMRADFFSQGDQKKKNEISCGMRGECTIYNNGELQRLGKFILDATELRGKLIKNQTGFERSDIYIQSVPDGQWKIAGR